jgi:hypothetical protein
MVGIAKLGVQLTLAFFKGIRDVLQEDQTQYYVLVERGIQGGAQLIGGGPELFLKFVEELLFNSVHGVFQISEPG